METSAGSGPRWRHPLLLGAVLVIAALIAHAPALNGSFIWDDDDYIVNNEALRDGAGLVELWQPGTTKQYYPLVFTTFWIEYQAWGPKPFGFHLTNILLHIVNALLVWRLFTVLGVRGAWLIAAVFALHPVHVESVAWASERKNVLSAALYLGAALTYLRFDRLRFEPTSDTDHRAPWPAYAATIALFVGALLSKTVTCSLPAALCLALLWLRRPMSVKRLLPLLPLFVIGLCLALNTAHLEKTSVGAVGADFDISLVERMLIAARALAFYPGTIIAPGGNVFVYPRWAIDTGSLAAWAFVGGGAMIIMLCIIAFVRGHRGVPLALAFYAGTILPALGFINIYPMRYTFVADHYQYLASLGVIAALVGSVATILSKRDLRIGGLPVGAIIGALAVVVLIPITRMTGAKYASLDALWTHTIAGNPSCWMAHNNLGNVLVRREQFEDALPRYRAALEIKPDHYQSRRNLAATLDALGRHAEAIPVWETALTNERVAFDDRVAYAASLEQAGRIDDAAAAYRAILAKRPDLLLVHVRLGDMFVRAERPADAVPHYEAVATAQPSNARVHMWLGMRFENTSDYADAERHFRAVMDGAGSDTDRTVAAFRVARLLALCPDADFRRPAEAVRIAERLARVTGGRDPLVLDTLGAGLAGLGRYDEAILAAEKALGIARNVPQLESLATEIEGRIAGYRAAASSG
ncbi:MAG: tetratricopeptide repeat protein [Planctomycetota bacterium]